MSKQNSSSVMASVHETAKGLHSSGIMDKKTMREFDDLCLTPVRQAEQKKTNRADKAE
jgi:putative transcriptional regulator